MSMSERHFEAEINTMFYLEPPSPRLGGGVCACDAKLINSSVLKKEFSHIRKFRSTAACFRDRVSCILIRVPCFRAPTWPFHAEATTRPKSGPVCVILL